MQVLQKLSSALLVAFLMTFASAAVAASGVTLANSTGIDSGAPQQSPAPPDCKKDPTDPRCKK